MIASWMLAATALSLALGFAAFAGERALRIMGRQARATWVAALVVSAAWPVLAPLLSPPGSAMPRSEVVATTAAGSGLAAVDVPTARTARAAPADVLDGALAIAWLTATLLLLARAAAGMRALRRLVRAAAPQRMDGEEVLISPGGGPAAFGIVRPRILLPRWMLDLDDATRAIVLRHEREHLRAGDPALLAVAWALVALMPWNVGLWWITRRLRVSAELDCDRRVIRSGIDARAYSRLLLFISQRQAHSPLAVAMAGSPSTLHERISAMHPDRPARPRLRAAALSILALVAATGASSPVIADPLVRVRPRILSALERSASTARPITLPPAVQQPVPQQPVPQQPVPQQPVPPRPTKQPPRVLAPARVDSTPRRGSPPPTVTKRAPTDSIAKRPPTDSAAKRAPSAPAAQRPDSVAAKSPPPALVDSSARAEPLTRQRPAPILLVHVDSGAGRQSYYDFAVQAPVDFAPGGSPALRYPDILHSAQRGGVLVVQMVVDTSGLMLPGSLRVVHKSHDLFEASFRAEMDKLRFRPARVGEQRVRQLVQLVYRFRVDGMEAIAPVEVSSDVRTLEVTVSVKPR